jgi:hypothetical protein
MQQVKPCCHDEAQTIGSGGTSKAATASFGWQRAMEQVEPYILLEDDYFRQNQEVVRPRVEKTEKYRALKSDTVLESAFDKYMSRLKEKESGRDDRGHGRRDNYSGYASTSATNFLMLISLL